MTNGSNPYAPPPPSGGGGGNPTYNPYAPPSANLGGPGSQIDDAEHIRNEHLSHEASLRSFGCLYYWIGILILIAAVGFGIFMIFSLVSGEGSGKDLGLFAAFSVIYGLLGWLYIWLGKGLRALEEKVRLLLTIFGVLGLLGFPLGTLINGYFLYLLHSEKGKRIMTPEYRQVVAQTPHIKYRTPLWVWLLLGLLVLGIIVAIALGAAGV